LTHKLERRVVLKIRFQITWAGLRGPQIPYLLDMISLMIIYYFYTL